MGAWGWMTWDWLKDYLTTCEQQVRVNGTPSAGLNIPAGVPQGSVLGPLLFLTYTSDLPEAVADVSGSSCEQFADDTNLTSINSRADLTEDNLQVAINQTALWLRVWRLCVNPQKTVIMETSRRPLPTPLSIKLAQDALTKVQSHRHLGIILSIARNTATPYKEIYGKSPVCGRSRWLGGGKKGLSRRSKRQNKPESRGFAVFGGLPVRRKHR